MRLYPLLQAFAAEGFAALLPAGRRQALAASLAAARALAQTHRSAFAVLAREEVALAGAVCRAAHEAAAAARPQDQVGVIAVVDALRGYLTTGALVPRP